MDLIINRKFWLRGEGSESSYLLRYGDQKMCCLGFYAKVCGLEPKDIQSVQAPDGTGEDHQVKPYLPLKWQAIAPWLFQNNHNIALSADCRELMELNDNEFSDSYDLSDQEEKREESIAIIFARNGVNVTFVDE